MTAAALKIESDGVGDSSDELRPGTKLLFGQFTIESFLNAGGFGIVYLARDSLDRRVVVKECFPSSYCRRIGKTVGPGSRSRQEEFRSVVQLFMQEAVTLSQLNHTNIVKVLQVFEDNETAYIAMDYVEGPDLLETVEGTAPALSPAEIQSILGKMLDAVGYVHAQGLLHRDISPDNILLDKATGQPVLIDFGASRKEVTRKSRALSGLRVVKDGYSPQELYVSGSKQAPFSDLYALAATFYHLISGESPKTSQERLSAIAGREGDPLRPLAGRFKAYPAEFLRAIDKAMSIFPRDRLQSVDEWRAMLGGVADIPPAGTVAAMPEQPAEATLPEPVAPAPIAVELPEPAMEAPAVPAAAVVEPPVTALPTVSRARDVLLVSTAAILLLVGLLALPGNEARVAGGPAETGASAPVLQKVAPDGGTLAVTSTLRLPSGLAFDAVETATGTMTVVAAVPDGVATDLQVGDVLLVYAASGEPLGTANALREILTREYGNGITTYGFVIRRGDITMDAELRLGVSG
jgi:Protein kinase domain